MKKNCDLPATKQDLKNLITKPELRKVEKRVGGVEKRLGGVEKRLGGVEKRLGGVEKHLEGVDKRLGCVEKRVDQVDKSLLSFKGEVDERFQSVEDRIGESQSKVLGVLSDVMGELKTIREGQEMFVSRTYENTDKLEDHEVRIKDLEKIALVG